MQRERIKAYLRSLGPNYPEGFNNEMFYITVPQSSQASLSPAEATVLQQRRLLHSRGWRLWLNTSEVAWKYSDGRELREEVNLEKDMRDFQLRQRSVCQSLSL